MNMNTIGDEAGNNAIVVQHPGRQTRLAVRHPAHRVEKVGDHPCTSIHRRFVLIT